MISLSLTSFDPGEMWASNGTNHTCGVLVFAFKSTSTAANSTQCPSGETCGSSTRFSAIMSSKVNGCFDCAEADCVSAAMASTSEDARARKCKGGKRRMDGPPDETK